MAKGNDEKRTAQDDRDSWKRTSIWASALGSFLSLGAGGAVAAAAGAAIGGPVLAGGILVTLCLKTNADLKSVEAQRKIEDPPRVDFLEPTVARLVVPFRDAFGISDLDRAMAGFSRAVVETISLESAMVTAEERKLGAELLGNYRVVQLQDVASKRLRAAAGRWNLQLGLYTRQLSERIQEDLLANPEFISALDELDQLQAKGKGERRLSLQLTFPDAVGTLAACGYPDVSFGRDNPEEAAELRGEERGIQLVEALQGASGAAYQYGRVLFDSVAESDYRVFPSSPPLSQSIRASLVGRQRRVPGRWYTEEGLGFREGEAEAEAEWEGDDG